MINKILYRVLSALAALFCLCSCGLEEPFGSSQDGGVIEFVARPVGFNNQTVETKSTAIDFEKTIYNCFFLLFDNDPNSENYGNLINTPANLIAGNSVTKFPGIKLKDINTASVTACFVANVPSDFIDNIEGLNRPTGVTNNLENNQKYLNSAVLTGISYGTGENFGRPCIDFDGAEGSNQPVPCIPMIGVQSIALPITSGPVEIPIQRLFAKISVSLDMDMGLSATASYYSLISYKISNLPTMVSLIAPSGESAWIRGTGEYEDAFYDDIFVLDINEDIYNGTDPYEFSFYAPEYYLSPKASTTTGYGEPKYKPTMFDSAKRPVYITLNGMFNPMSFTGSDKKSMKHLVYLGEDSSTSFTLRRNVHYNNLLTINGVNNSSTPSDNQYLDHRVIINETFNTVDAYGQSANCYIINTAGTYCIPAVKGAHKGDLTKLADKYKCTRTDTELKVVSYTNGIEINNLNYNKDDAEITFEIPSKANGNAVIALAYLDGNNEEQYEWSWHLWFDESAEILNQEVFEIATEEMPDGTTEMMNRNLGSAPNTLQLGVPGMASGGTYYRYGRKEPYFNNGYQGGGVIIGDDLKEETGWSNSKSSTDPCPPGYRIPSTSVWSGDNFNNATREHAEVPVGDSFIGFRYWNSGTTSMINGGLDYLLDDIYYPYSGYIDSSLNHQSTRDNRSVTKTYNANDYGLTNFSKSFNTNIVQIGQVEDAEKFLGYVITQKRTVQRTEYELTNFSYSLDLEYSKLGYLWGASKVSLSYLSLVNNWKNFQINGCTVQYRQVNQVQRRTRTIEREGWNIKIGDWGEWFDLGSSTYGSSTTISATKDTELPVVGNIDNTSYRNDLKSHQFLRSFQTSESSVSTFTTDPNEGYQVRCVKE